MEFIILFLVGIVSLDMVVNRGSGFLPTWLFVTLSGLMCLSVSIHILVKVI